MACSSFIIFFLSVFFPTIYALETQSVLLYLSWDTRYRCASPGCSPSQNLSVSNLQHCQMSCLMNTMCRTVTFSRIDNICEIFVDTPSQYGLLVSQINSVTMIAIDSRRLSAPTTPVATSTTVTTSTSTSTSSTVTTTTVLMSQRNMNIGRFYHTATTLSNGKVFVTGGTNFTAVLNSAELYDPATDNWATVASMFTMRMNHVAVELSNGTVLIAGGSVDINNTDIITDTEIYHVANNTWIRAANMTVARSTFTLTPLINGDILAIGGVSKNSTYTNTAELYNATSNSWTRVANMSRMRSGHQATLLANDRVLVTGGFTVTTGSLSSSEIYNLGSNTWTFGSNISTGRSFHTATTLLDGRIFITGGLQTVNSTIIYNSSADIWTSTSSMNYPRQAHRATRLLNGTVLVTGGNPVGTRLTAELYDPMTNTWTILSNMNTSRLYHTATLLFDGRVLIAGGVVGGTGTRIVEFL